MAWFWSDQYELKLQITGLRDGHDEVVVRGDPATHTFMVCYLRGGELMAVEAVNNPREFMACHDLIARCAQCGPQRLADITAPLS